MKKQSDVSKAKPPRDVELNLVNATCDFCQTKLDGLKKVWVWNEHWACSREHVQRAQAATNRGETDADLL